MSTVEGDAGPFTVYVVLENLEHPGNVTYDDNRDGIPDRTVSSPGLGAFQFTIEYNDAIVEFEEAARGPELSSTGRSFQCLPARRDGGAVTFGCLSPGANPAGPQGTLTLASVQFSPRGSGLSPLVLSAEVGGPLGDSAEVDVGGGAVRVNGNAQAVPTDALSGSSTATPIGPGALPGTGEPDPSDPSRPVTPDDDATVGPGSTTSPDGQTATALEVRANVTPGADDVDRMNDEDGDSSRRWWLWIIGIAAGATLGAGGLAAFLARRRAEGGL